MKQITVFTPTYNRINLLERCYKSMQKQTDSNFIWIIIDDGSTDNTQEVVKSWINNNNAFQIEYYYKNNGGLASAYNEAISHINTELCVCIDSDDYMPDNAIEKILTFWKKNGSNKYAGIVGLDFDLNGNVIGDPLPNIKSVNLIDLLTGKYHINNGDRTNVVRTSLYKEVAPMQLIEGEKNFNPHYMHLQISKNYDFLVMNENLRFVEYQQNGMSSYIYKQYYNSPNSFLETRRLYLTFKNATFKFLIKNAIHYVSSSILSKKFIKSMLNSPKPLLTFISIFPGFLLTLLIIQKNKTGN